VGFSNGRELVGVMLCIVEKAKRATYLTVPGGPLIDWEDKKHQQIFKETVIKIAKQMGCVFVRVRPQILQSEKNSKLFEKLEFKLAPMHLHAELTRQLDLTKSVEQLLSEMRKTTRYEIKKAIKLGIKITTSKDIDDINQFYKLQYETAKRQHFVEFDKKFLMEQFATFVKDDQVLLFTAYLGNKKLAQAFIIFYGDSTLDGRKYPGAYLIQWEAIKEAKKRGLKRYNLWGVAPEGNPNHRFWGVSVFKRGFGGQDLEYLHARDLVIEPISYKLNWVIETIRKKTRRV
jgi:lipid II:glycine glycyltransferase (peptidoglycan interpeptide bridge formation enzyme)